MPRSVLIVDDDAGFRDLATRVLTGWGHVVVGGVGSVAEALARAEESRPDVVLVDVGLPDGDGFCLTERLVVLPWPMSVVVISSDPDETSLRTSLRAGARTFVPKDEIAGTVLRRLIEDES